MSLPSTVGACHKLIESLKAQIEEFTGDGNYSSKKIAEDLLKEAGHYWYGDNSGVTVDINEYPFDPGVDKIFKSNAIELSKLYAEIAESRKRIISNLARTLIPDSTLLPVPGVTVGQVTTDHFRRIEVTPETNFTISGQDKIGNKAQYNFTPLFHHEFPKSSIKYAITNTGILDWTDDKSNSESTEETEALWIGIDIDSEDIEKNDKLIFFWGDQPGNKFDKDFFAIYSAKWSINGEKELPVKIGLEHFRQFRDSDLADTLNIPNNHEKEIVTRFKDSFVTIDSLPENLEEYKRTSPLLGKNLLDQISDEDSLLWIKISFKLPVPIKFLSENKLNINCIPLVNRELKSEYIERENYPTIILPMSTKYYFLSVNKIRDTKFGEEYKRVDFISPQREPGTYMMRSSSGMRRFNGEDATKQIDRLLEIIKEESAAFKEGGVNHLKEKFNTINEAIESIRQELYEEYYNKIIKTSYFAIASFKDGAQKIRYSYWETRGDAVIILKDDADIKSEIGINGKTIIPLIKGKGELKEEDYINRLKSTILSRNRIVTKGDIEQYCKSVYPELIKYVKTKNDLEIQNNQFRRIVLVTLIIEDYENMGIKERKRIIEQLQTELNTIVAVTTFIKVTLSS